MFSLPPCGVCRSSSGAVGLFNKLQTQKKNKSNLPLVVPRVRQNSRFHFRLRLITQRERAIIVEPRARGGCHVRPLGPGRAREPRQLRRACACATPAALATPCFAERRARSPAIQNYRYARSCMRYSAVHTHRCSGQAPAKGVSPTD